MVKLDIISDPICPWCYIGKRRLETAIADAELALDIRWRPFQLDPTLPPGGKDRKIYLAEKFGSIERARELYENIREAGEAEKRAEGEARARETPGEGSRKGQRGGGDKERREREREKTGRGNAGGKKTQREKKRKREPSSTAQHGTTLLPF